MRNQYYILVKKLDAVFEKPLVFCAKGSNLICFVFANIRLFMKIHTKYYYEASISPNQILPWTFNIPIPRITVKASYQILPRRALPTVRKPYTCKEYELEHYGHPQTLNHTRDKIWSCTLRHSIWCTL